MHLVRFDITEVQLEALSNLTVAASLSVGRRPGTAELRARFSSIWPQRPDGRPSLRPRCGIDLAAVSQCRPLLILCQMGPGPDPDRDRAPYPPITIMGRM
jgi:hypothetical protein